jgi:hypothetical protein
VNHSNFVPDKDELLAQLNRINKRSAIGRSKNYRKLLGYLANRGFSADDEQSAAHKTPKEIEIAIDVFGKNVEFNPAEDSTVRVHISNLRKKLETYYEEESDNEPFRISIPSGGYRLLFTESASGNLSTDKNQPAQSVADTKSSKSFFSKKLVVAFVTLSIVVHITLVLKGEYVSTEPKEIEHKIWSNVLGFDQPVIIALGDGFVIDQQAKYVSDSMDKASLKLVSEGSVIALKNIVSMFDEPKFPQIRLASNLTAKEIRHYNVIYIGDFKSMGKLGDYFKGSNFKFNSKQNTIDRKGSELSYPAPQDFTHKYIDHGIFARIDGPRDHKIYIIAGFSDSSILQISWFFTTNSYLFSDNFADKMTKYGLDNYNNFELLFKVPSLEGIDLTYKIVSGDKVDEKLIWE